jgi:predicted DNA-binding antitoxin AbrB/MazE fold protein
METVRAYYDGNVFVPLSPVSVKLNQRVIITMLDEISSKKIKEPKKHITLAERLKNWDGKPYELSDEDREWLNMEDVGEELC